jgi:hypothetical protein
MPHRFDRYASIPEINPGIGLHPDSFQIIPCDGIPFVVVGRKLLECHQGIDRDGHRKEKTQE